MRRSSLCDAHLGAARVGDQCPYGSVPRNFGEKVDGCGNGQRNVNQVGVLQRRSEFAGKRFVDGTARLRFSDNFRAVPARNTNVRGVFAKGQPQGAANEPGAEDGDAIDDMRRHSQCSVLGARFQFQETKIRGQMLAQRPRGRKGSQRASGPGHTSPVPSGSLRAPKTGNAQLKTEK